MADGNVEIIVNVEDGEAKKKLEGVEDAAEDAAKGLDDLGDSAEKTSKGFGIADVAIGSFIANGVTALVGKVGEAISSLVALADETREYREDMAKLEAAFTTAGHSTETANKAYNEFYKILGESDRSVEAVNHLAELTDNTEDLSKWSTIAAGVTAKFGDSLPIEGLTEAANETAKVGQVTGAVADALNWAGISEDTFNEKLKACNTEQERATLITDTLSKEYQAAADEYNTLTASTQAAREATNNMEQAQANLGGAIEPVTTAWTNLKATALNWLAEGLTPIIQNTIEAVKGIDALSESQRASVTAAHEAAAAYRDTKDALYEMAAAQISDVDYATNYLVPQLQELIDTNGRVKQGYEERANFILTQMNEAWGTEYTRISEIIGANGQLRQSVLDTIEAKRAQILLSAHEEAYKTAVQNVAEAERVRAQQAGYLADQTAVVAAAELELKAVRDEVVAAAQRGDQATVRSLGERVKDMQSKVDTEKATLKGLQDDYAESEKNLFTYYEDINTYQTASTLLMEGKTAEAVGYLNDLSAGYDTTTGNVQGSIEEQRKALEQQVIDTEVNAQLMKEAYKNGVKGVSEEMVKTAEAQAAAAKEKFYNVGGDITKGIAEGAEGEEKTNYTLSGAMKRLVNKALEAAKKAGMIKSPSRLFRDEIGKMISAGIAVGIEKNADKPVEAVKTVFDTLEKYLEEEHKKSIKTVKDYNAEIESLEKEHNEKIAELDKNLIEDKKKKNADKKALEERYAKDIENINKQHADKLKSIQDNINKTITNKMQEVVNLGKTYKENLKKLWEDLDNSLTALQSEYDNQLASRTESIAGALNLWAEAEKKTVKGSELRNNLRSQIDVLEDYNKAIEILEKRRVSEDFINSLKKMGVASTGEIEAISKMTDKQLKKYVALWEQKNELAKEAAIEELEPLKAETVKKIDELTNAAVLEYQQLRADYKEEATLLMSELKQAMIDAGEGGYNEIISQIDDYTAAGGGLMSGIVAGVITASPVLTNAVTRAVRNAIDAGKVAAEGNPSSVRVPDIKSELSKSMQDITARVKTAIDTENARMAQGTGGISTGVADLINAVGTQTAGINSLASMYGRGQSNTRPIILQLNERELGRAIVDIGSTEETRLGVKISYGGVR